MPTFEGTCENSLCERSGDLFEYLLKKWDNPDPNCPECGTQVTRMMSSPRISWAKDIGQYCGQNTEGHWATSRDPETQEVTKHFIRTRQDQKEFCKRYGYHDPTEIPSEVTAGKDGKERNTRGEKGTWI